jgi:hypothetical protein
MRQGMFIDSFLKRSYVTEMRWHEPSQQFIAEIGYHEIQKLSADDSVQTCRVRTATKLHITPPENKNQMTMRKSGYMPFYVTSHHRLSFYPFKISTRRSPGSEDNAEAGSLEV